MTTAQTEARAIAQRFSTFPPSDREALAAQIVTALAAKDAELAAQLRATQDAWNERDGEKRLRLRTEAQRDEALKALEPFADIADLIDSETEGVSDTDELELHFHDYLMASWPVSLLRAARRALTGGQDDG